VALAHLAERVGVLHFLGRDLEHAPRLRVGGRAAQRPQQRRPQARQRVLAGRAGCLVAGALQRQGDPVHHRVEQVGLVLEVPVDCTAGGAGGRGDVLQRGARDALGLEQTLRRVQQ